MQIKARIKPLSVNEAWQGKRFKTKKYKMFERDYTLFLPNKNISKNDILKVSFVFGFSNKSSDIDNPIKPTLDVLCKNLGFDDRQIYELAILKEIVPKGKEFINVKIEASNGIS